MFNSQSTRGALLEKLGHNRPVRLRSGGGSRLWRLRSPAVGVKISGGALHLASLRPGLGRRWIVSTGVIPEYAQLQPHQLGERLRDFLQPLDGEEPIVVLGLPRREAVVRLCTLPRVTKNAQREALSLQAEMYKPTDEGAFCWDALLQSANGNVAVSLALATRDQVDRLAGLFAGAGCPLARITLGQFALLHLVLRNRPETSPERLVVIDVSESDAEISIVDKGQLVYTRAFLLKTDGPVAEQALASELQQAFATLRWKEDSSVQILLAGSSGLVLEPVLSPFGKVGRLKNWLGLQGEQNLDREESLGAVALALEGLAWRGANRINLLPAELRPSRRRWRYAPTYALVAANIILLLVFAVREPIQRQIVVRQYQREITKLQKVSNQAQDALDKQKQAYQRLELIRDFQLQGHESLDALAEVTQRLPADTWLNHFGYRLGQIDMNGTSKSAAALLPLLEASPQFTNVKFSGGLTRDPSGADRFRLQLQVKQRP
jgi:Tfp pilus assembly protein PilN